VTPDQEEDVTRKALVSAAVLSAAIAPAAQGHTLGKGAAKEAAKKALAGTVAELGGKAGYKCERKSAHRVDCQMSLVTLDGSACSAVVKVTYKNHKARQPRTRIIDGPDCVPPELPVDIPDIF
jgi:hypothetical protein